MNRLLQECSVAETHANISSTVLRRVTRRLARSLFIAAGLVAIGVSLAYGWPWSTDMEIQPSIQPQEDPRLPPPDTIPRHGKEPRMDLLEAAENLHNPVQPNATSIESGKRLFEIYCLVCHGPAARGDGPIARKLEEPPDDLTEESAVELTDGYIYTVIREGGTIMPPQAEGLSSRERWDVVNYLRSLQRKAEAR